MTSRYPYPAPIDAYGNGGFRFAGMSHRGSILCLPSGIHAWPVTTIVGLIEAELAPIYARLGATLPTPDPSRVKGRHNYAARIVVTVVTCGVYHFWWLYDMQVEGNRHVEMNWPWEDALAGAVQALVASPSA